MDDYRRTYRKLNAGFETRYLHLFGRGAGFSAEFIHVLKAVAECLGTGVQFCLQLNRKPRGFAVESGWADYFEPLWPEVSAGIINGLNRLHFPLGRLSIGKNISRPLLRWSSGCEWFLFDGLGSRPPARLDFPNLGLGMSYWENMQHLSQMLWTYNATTGKALTLLREALVRGPFVAAHIRRGDKKTEADYVPAALYAKAIKKLACDLRNVYIATDDHSTVEQLIDALGPGFNVYCSANDHVFRGYNQTAFNDSTAEQRRQKTLEFFVELESLFDSTLFFGTPTSNVFNLVQYMKGNKGVVDVTSPNLGRA